MVERQHHGELREVLEGCSGVFLVDFCDILSLPRSVPKYRKIEYILDSGYDYEEIIRKLNHLRFGKKVENHINSKELTRILDEYGLSRRKLKKEKMVEIIGSEKVSPRALLGSLDSTQLRKFYYELMEEETNLDRNEIIRFLIGYYTLQWLEGVKGTAFIMMPFSDDPILEGTYRLIKNECEIFDIKATRIDEYQTSGKITEDIINEICKSEYLFVDVSKENPNVYYELGYAHGYGKSYRNIILMAQKGETLHFDIKDMRTIIYRNQDDLQTKLHKRLKSII